MNWTFFLAIGAVVAVLLVVKRLSLVSAADARDLLKQGALVIDVRTPGEFQSGHVAKAINIPLDDLGNTLSRRVSDKNQVLLLHCLSGTRSGMAKGQLKRMGYRNVHNLGSFSRARSIVSGGKS